MNTRANLIAAIEAFCEHHRISEARLGALACNDAKVCARIRRSSVTLSRIETIEAFMAAHSLAAPRGRARERGAASCEAPAA